MKKNVEILTMPTSDLSTSNHLPSTKKIIVNILSHEFFIVFEYVDNEKNIFLLVLKNIHRNVLKTLFQIEFFTYFWIRFMKCRCKWRDFLSENMLQFLNYHFRTDVQMLLSKCGYLWLSWDRLNHVLLLNQICSKLSRELRKSAYGMSWISKSSSNYHKIVFNMFKIADIRVQSRKLFKL